MTTVASVQSLGLQVPHILVTRTSLFVEEGATEQDLVLLEQSLDTLGGSVLWWWGDYINHLASTRGVEYAEAKAASSYAPQTLKNAAWQCRHVDPSRRRDRPLTYSHHSEVAALSPTDQEIWLAKAEEGTDGKPWSQKQLRTEIRQSKAQVTNGPDQAPQDQRAARASASFEQFAAWYQTEAPKFTHAQRREWDVALEPLVTEYLSRNTHVAVFTAQEVARR